MGIKLIKKESAQPKGHWVVYLRGEEWCTRNTEKEAQAVVNSYDGEGECWYEFQADEAVHSASVNAYTFAEPSFGAVTYGLEEISKNDSGEIEVVDAIDSDGSAQALADEVAALHKRHPERKYHITAIGTDSDGIADRSEVIWSDYPEEVSADENAPAKNEGRSAIRFRPQPNEVVIMPRIKMVEANDGLTLANLTFDNVADYRGVPLTERQPNGTVVHLIGAFTAFNGDEFFALDNGHYVTLKGLRMHYQTPDDISGSSEYANAIYKAYLKEIKKRGYTIPKKNKFGWPNPREMHVDFTDASGEEGTVYVKPKPSGVDVCVESPGDPNAWKNRWKEYKSARLSRLGSPAEAAAFIVNDHPLVG